MGNGQWGTARWLWLLLALLGITMIAWGVHTGQMADVKRHAEVLCTDCIGLGGQ
jgi:nitrogen fixation-related uncharacterized protein